MHRIHVVSLALAFAGCAYGHETTPTPATRSGEVPVPATPSRPGGGSEDGSSVTAPRTSFKTPVVPVSPEPSDTGPGAHGPVPVQTELRESLDDEKILEVARVVSGSAVDEGQLARSRAASPGVRRLAEGIIEDGRSIEHRGDKIARATRLLPQESALSVRFEQARSRELESLAGRRGRAFDRAFVRDQADRQQQLIQLIDHTLLPNASSPQVRTFLLGLRPVAERRYEQALAIKEKLE